MKYYYLHGFASGPKSYKALYFKDQLKTDFKIDLIIPDLNQPNFESMTLSSQMDFLNSLFKGDEEIFLFGSSLGAYLSILLNENKALPIKAMFLMAPAFEFLKRQLDRISKTDLENWKKTDKLEVYHHGSQENRYLSFQIIEDAQKYEKDEYQINCETNVFHGYQDEVVSWELSRNYLQTKENVSVKYVNSDHELISCMETMYKSAHQLIESLQ